MAFTMTDSQQVDLGLAAADKKNNPVAFDAGSLAVLSSNTDVLNVSRNADGVSATAVAVGPLGTATITVNATVGGAAVSGSLDVTIVSGAPTQITITPGVPAEQP